MLFNILENNVPTNRPVTEYCEDIQAAVYSAAIHKRCIYCGKTADLHHVDRVGMGGDRHDMCHIGLKALPLCREHHMEAHQHGDEVLIQNMCGDALAYIKRLEAEVIATRVRLYKEGDLCRICKARGAEDCTGDCNECDKAECCCKMCIDTDGKEGYEWDGGENDDV